MEPPQFFEYLNQSVDYKVCDTKFIPVSAKFVVLGQRKNCTGTIEIYEMDGNELRKIKEIDKERPVRCGTFGASSLSNRHLAIGSFVGRMEVLDLERPESPVYSVNAHQTIIHAIDGMGGKEVGCGPPEILTGGRDGAVKVWDIRQAEVPVVHIKPNFGDESLSEDNVSGCWAVAFGDSFSNSDRTVAAGFANGDLKLIDLRAMRVRWETNVENGICSLEFDQRNIPMNRLAVVTTNGGVLVYDMQTPDPTYGFSCVEKQIAITEDYSDPPTMWSVRHLPQNPDFLATCDSNGTIRLWNYECLKERQRKVKHHDGDVDADADADEIGFIKVKAKLRTLTKTKISEASVYCLDWHPDKIGLAVCGANDKTVRVMITTNLNSSVKRDEEQETTINEDL